MPRLKSLPTKRALASRERSVSKRQKQRQRHSIDLFHCMEPLVFSSVDSSVKWSDQVAWRLELPVDSTLLLSCLYQLVCKIPASASHVQLLLTLEASNQVHVQVHGRQEAGTQVVALSEVFSNTYETWQAHMITLVKRQLVQVSIHATRGADETNWSFRYAISIAWRKYMETYCFLAPPRAEPMRAMYHVMIWVLKKSHDVQSKVCRFRYWNEIEVLYDCHVGDNSVVCAGLQAKTFVMPEIYARIDAAQQLKRDMRVYDAAKGSFSDLLPALRPYQKAAVCWMLSREKPVVQPGNSLTLGVTFDEATARSLAAYDPFSAAFYASPSASMEHHEILRPLHCDVSSIRGGILADEMGLGKTVEVIALILGNRNSNIQPQLLSTHFSALSDEIRRVNQEIACICGSSASHSLQLVQCEFCGTWHHELCTGYTVDARKNASVRDAATTLPSIWNFENPVQTLNERVSTWSSGTFMCYHCQSQERPSFTCRTTLIVSPESIHAQWEHEISRHVSAGALSVLRYPGVHGLKTKLDGKGPSAEWQVLASPGLVLARYDLVLTTYEALGADLRYVPTTQGSNRRASTRSRLKRYAFVGSPLVALRFWRVCMDEAQVGVENTRLQASLTLSRLSAEHRWVVTGTPFSSCVRELFGYLRFLRIAPYASSYSPGADKCGKNLQFLQAQHTEQERCDFGYFRTVVERTFARGAVERVLELLLWDGQCSLDVVCGGGLLWRTGKKNVVEQLDLPPQTREIVWCHFAAVERHFYDQQEQRILSLVQQRERERAEEVVDRDDRLWQDLLLLRQLCCHPQVGGARQAWGSTCESTSQAVVTMDAFLQKLVEKSTRECEEAQRQLIGAQNGLAALLVLDHDLSGAALKYMAVIRLIRTNWTHFRADLLPRLHILQNLAKCVQQLYSLPPAHCASESNVLSDTDVRADPKDECLFPMLPALEKRISSAGLLPDSSDLSDDDRMKIRHEWMSLGQSARWLRQSYLRQVETMHVQALGNFKRMFQMINEAQHHSETDLLCTSGTWWSIALSVIKTTSRSLVTRVRARLSGFDTRWGRTICSQVSSTQSLGLILVRELEALATRRRLLLKRLITLSEKLPTPVDVELSGNCRKCRDGGTGPICSHCQLYHDLELYRHHFLGIEKTVSGKNWNMEEVIDDNDEKQAGVGAAKDSAAGLSVSLFVEIFKEISGCACSSLRSHETGRQLVPQIQTSMQREIDFWTRLQREWQAAKKLLQAQHQRLGALDELVMACSQLRLRQADEKVASSKAERLYKLEREEVPVRTLELEADRAVADVNLRENMAQLRYLVQLQREASAPESKPALATTTARPSSPESTQPTCPVCLEKLTEQRAVLPCAHVYCMNCSSSLTGRQHTRRSVRCPTCRRVWSVDSVTLVVDGLTSNSARTRSQPLSKHAIDGGFGSKLDALVTCVDKLRQEDPCVKCLLFSQWSQLLEFAMQALRPLGVRCFLFQSKRALPKLLSEFQTCPAACVLALPFKIGANGLNLVEATEVLLLEPLLSTSIEAQAVNRVHRLGQTLSTRVHRFLVADTIEERIFWHGHKQQSKRQDRETEQRSGNEMTDEAEVERLGVVPGRGEPEKLTMKEFQALLRA